MVSRAKQLKYISIAREVEKFIETAAAGDRLPSDRNLARRFACSALTVRKALDSFAKRGRIVRRVGSGTFVNGVEQGRIAARGYLASRKLDHFGVLMHAAADEYALMVIHSVHEAAAENSITLHLRYVPSFGDASKKIVGDLMAEGCSALVIPWFPPSQTGEVAEFIRSSPIPASVPVMIPGLEGSCFEKPEIFGKGTISQTLGACRYFKLLGAAKIVLLGPNVVGDAIMQRRLAAYSNFVFDNDMPNISALVGGSLHEMDRFARNLKDMGRDVAVVCHDDLHALRLMNAMRKIGLSAPGDFRIVGCNNTREGLFADPPLTSIYDDYSYPGRSLVRAAMALARGRLEQSASAARHFLVVRDSCGGKSRLSAFLKSKIEGLGMTVHCGMENEMGQIKEVCNEKA